MLIDALVAEIGSTTTVVSAFDHLDVEPCFLGQGQWETTAAQGDVRIGLDRAVEALTRKLLPRGQSLSYRRMFASSSAAGGLKMCVYGLVYDMTVHAAEAAALGAGAVLRRTVAGKLSSEDLLQQEKIAPNLILLAGGTDWGERETALFNARALAGAGCAAPVIYAGNVANREAVERIFSEAGIPCFITQNVYPRLDQLNVEPCRRAIQEAFEKHIVTAPGMEKIRDMVTDKIMPTPGAVMEALGMLRDSVGDVVALDIGGATTDVHSAAAGSEEIAAVQTRPEPFCKRTVEGDLGVFVNAANIVKRIGQEKLDRELSLNTGEVMASYQPIPITDGQKRLTYRLALEAGIVALKRHAGVWKHQYTPSGRRTYAEGKDLTKVRTVVGTGGALTRLEGYKELLKQISSCNTDGSMLFPKPGEARLLYDKNYIMASLGVLGTAYPQAAKKLLLESLEA